MIRGDELLLSQVSLRNFKSIQEADLTLRPLTILVGENSAGKSSVLQAIFLLAQAVRGRTRPELIALNGIELSLGNFEDVLHSGAPSEHIELSLSMHLGPEAMFRRRREYPGTLLDSHSRPATRRSSAEAIWTLELEHSSEPGVALVSGVELTDSAAGESLRLFRNPDAAEISELYDHSRRLGLLGRRPVERSRLVSDIERMTAFAGVVSREPGLETAIGEEAPTDFPAVAMENGFPTELYEFKSESTAISRRWIDLVLRRTEFEVRGRRRGYEEPTVGARTTALRRRRRVEDWHGPEPGEVAEIVFPDFYRWVDAFDRAPAVDTSRPPPIAPLPTDIFEAIVGVEDNVALELCDLLESSRAERGAIGPVRTATLEVGQAISDLLYRSVHYLGPLREDPKPSYRAGHSGLVATLGVKGEYTVAALNANKNLPTLCPCAGEPTMMRLEEAVNYWSQRFNLAESIRTQDTGRPGIELLLVDQQTRESRDLTSVGVGASQLLPVIVLCLLAQPGELVLLEQPELHLHPAPQQVLGDFLLEIAQTGRQLLVETHSEYLINRLRLRVVDDDESSVQQAVQIWYARRHDGRTQFQSLEPNRFGSFDEWPEGFFDQAPREAEDILRAAARRRRQSGTRDGAGESDPRTTTGEPGIAEESVGASSSAEQASDGGVPVGIREHVIRHAPPELAQHELMFLTLASEELGLTPRRPSTGTRPHINLYPSEEFGRRRAAAFLPSTGRVQINCDPENAVGRRFAEIVENNGRPIAVRVYLRSKAAVDEAIDLTRIGLAER